MHGLRVASVVQHLINRNVINVMEDKACILTLGHGLPEANVEEHGTVELQIIRLINDINGMRQFLSLQIFMHVVEVNEKVRFAVPKRNDNSQ